MSQVPPPLPPPAGVPYPAGQPPVSPQDEKLWGMGAHLGMLLTGFVGPLVIYLVYRDRSRWIRDNALEALNFAILTAIVMLVSVVLAFIVIGGVTAAVWVVLELVFGIQAAVAANRGQFYRYPLNWRLVK